MLVSQHLHHPITSHHQCSQLRARAQQHTAVHSTWHTVRLQYDIPRGTQNRTQHSAARQHHGVCSTRSRGTYNWKGPSSAGCWVSESEIGDASRRWLGYHTTASCVLRDPCRHAVPFSTKILQVMIGYHSLWSLSTKISTKVMKGYHLLWHGFGCFSCRVRTPGRPSADEC